MVYLYRRGNGNDGNFARSIVELGDCDAYAALKALTVSNFIVGGKVRKHITKNLEVDGEVVHGLHGAVFEGPAGEKEFDAAWLTCELEPVTAEYADQSRLPLHADLKSALDRGAWQFYRKLTKVPNA